MIYLKYFILYSIFGFYFESTIFKFTNKNAYSGVLKGPYTLVYGIGGLISYIINNFLTIINNTYLNILICYIIFVIICTLVELLCGYLIKFIFNFDSWNYTNHKYHFGKYICLDYSLIWGLLALIFVKYSSNFFDNVLQLIPNYISFIIIFIIIIDFIINLEKRKTYTKREK